MSFNVSYLWECILEGIKYIPVTLKMTVIVFLVSVILGFLVATVRFYKVPVFSQFFNGFITIYLGIPMILALNVYNLAFVTFYNPIMRFLHINSTIRDAKVTTVAYFAMILGTVCFVSEIFRGAYQAIEKIQFEAGYSIGLSKTRTLSRIIVPQIIPVVLPGMVNSFAGTLKGMSMLSVIGICEIMNGSLIPCVETYSYVEGYVAAALLYWVLVIIIEQVGKWIEKYSSKYRRQVV